MAALTGSMRKPAAKVTTETIKAIFHPPILPKFVLSRAQPVSNSSFLLLMYEANTIGGTNITGYDSSIP